MENPALHFRSLKLLATRLLTILLLYSHLADCFRSVPRFLTAGTGCAGTRISHASRKCQLALRRNIFLYKSVRKSSDYSFDLFSTVSTGAGTEANAENEDKSNLGYYGENNLRHIEVMLSRCERLNLEALTDIILETCPHTTSVSAELVEERNAGHDSDSGGEDISTWEEQVQGTSNWVVALLRLSVRPAFRMADLHSILEDTLPPRSFTVCEPPREEGDDGAAVDWMLRVQQGWPPQVIGDLTVYFPWHQRPNCSRGGTTLVNIAHDNGSTNKPNNATAFELVLEGGAAFGTGDHPTTRLCVHWLSRTMSERDDKGEPWSLLDYGCGSAILAQAGMRFGAGIAVGVDIDRDALMSAHRNCQLNDLHVELFVAAANQAGIVPEDQGAPVVLLRPEEELCGRQFDLTVSNILAPVLIQLAPRLAAYTRPGGKLAISGVLAFQAPAVMEAFQPFFGGLAVEREEDGWVLITGERISSPS